MQRPRSVWMMDDGQYPLLLGDEHLSLPKPTQWGRPTTTRFVLALLRLLPLMNTGYPRRRQEQILSSNKGGPSLFTTTSIPPYGKAERVV